MSARQLFSICASECLALLVSTATAQTTWYVDDDGDAGNGCTSWADACPELQTALTLAVSSDEIRVAGGTYKPDQDEAGNVTAGDREATFQLITGVELYGGYAGLDDPESPDDRDIAVHETILSGDLSGDDLPVACAQHSPDCDSYGELCSDGSCIIEQNNAENSYHVVTGSGCSVSAVLDAFTVTAGNANAPYPDSVGGGMFNSEGSPMVTNCTFIGNSGGAGGGMYNNSSSPTLANCVFSGNFADFGGAIVNAEHSAPNLVNCSLVANAADRNFGGILHLADTTVTLTNCILWHNVDESGTTEYSQIASGGGAVINHSCIQGWTGDLGGVGNIGDDPLFIDSDGFDNIPGTDDDNLRLSPGSPCINTGDPDFIPEPGQTDLDGHARVLCGQVDMGAYEFGIGDFDCNQTVDLFDFADWAMCMTGPSGGPYLDGCEVFDFQYDRYIDLGDYSQFLSGFPEP